MIYVIILFIVLAIAANILPRLFNQAEKEHLPYVKKAYLMTNAERAFYTVLKEAAGDKYIIIPQVQLSKIVEIERYEMEWRKYFNKINQKSVDFVLFEKEFFSPVIAIELDDSSHHRIDREERDSSVNKILGKAGIRIEHVPWAGAYNVQELSQRLFPVNK